MIFVAVGTQKFQFNRLIKAIDEFAIKRGEVFFGQIGNSTYIPQNFEYKSFLNKEEFMEKIEKCDLIITHSGVATIIEALKLGKSVIVVPRLKKYGEHVDNHQIQIAESFDEANLVLMCYDINDLEKKVDKVKQKKFKKYISQKELMIKTIDDYLKKI